MYLNLQWWWTMATIDRQWLYFRILRSERSFREMYLSCFNRKLAKGWQSCIKPSAKTKFCCFLRLTAALSCYVGWEQVCKTLQAELLTLQMILALFILIDNNATSAIMLWVSHVCQCFFEFETASLKKKKRKKRSTGTGIVSFGKHVCVWTFVCRL